MTLARHLDIPLAGQEPDNYALLLMVTRNRLELRQTGSKAPGPVWIDFSSGKANYRRKHGGGRTQTLVRAVGVKGKTRPTILDGTAGLGQDSFVLASQGCRVEMLERNPVIAALLADGLRRAIADPEIGTIVRDNMVLSCGDSLTELTRITPARRPEVVYLDPMFPHRSKSALVKKEMRILRTLVGDDEDSDQLLIGAMNVASKRVVVKRPAYAPHLSELAPDLMLKTKNNRFDIYLLQDRLSNSKNNNMPLL